jgi:hypothetical protein
MPEGVIYPSVDLDEAVTGTRSVAVAFSFEGEPVSFSVDVDERLYAGASAAVKSVTRFGNARENDWIEDYYPAFVNEPNHDAFFADVLAELRAVRDARGLDSDRYAELMTVFAQSVTYRTDPVDLSPKFPVETLVEGDGDCDDKTLLLAGLLAREGYDVAIMLFEPEKHVALGLRTTGPDYEGTGYAYVETTTGGFIGMVPDELADGSTIFSEPRVFRLDGGTIAYTAGDQVAAILSARERAIAEAGAITADIATADAELEVIKAEVAAVKAELDALLAAGRIGEYNALVGTYNELAEEYNDAVRARNALAERYNRMAEIERIIFEGLSDRPGTYAAVAGAFD